MALKQQFEALIDQHEELKARKWDDVVEENSVLKMALMARSVAGGRTSAGYYFR